VRDRPVDCGRIQAVAISALLLCGCVAGAALAAAKPAPVWSLSFSPDGKLLAAGAYRDIRVWDMETRTAHTAGSLSGPVRSLAWSRDGQTLAAGSGKPGETGEVGLFAVAQAIAPGVAPVTIQEHKDVVESVAFAPGGEGILSAGMDEKALAVQINPRKVVAAMQDHTNRVAAVAVSPDGKYVATGSLDKTVKIWSGVDYRPLANIDANVGQVYALVFLPSGEFAVAGEDGNIRVHRLAETKTGKLTGINGSLVRTMGGNRTPILCLAADAKSGMLVSGGEDRTVKVYFPGSNGPKHVLKECPEAVYAVAVTPDGSTVAAGSRDGKIRLWNAAEGKLITELMN
jgi:WD40 repeat protein